MNIEFTDEEILTTLEKLGYKVEFEKPSLSPRRRIYQKLASTSYIMKDGERHSIYQVFKEELLKRVFNSEIK